VPDGKDSENELASSATIIAGSTSPSPIVSGIEATQATSPVTGIEATRASGPIPPEPIVSGIEATRASGPIPPEPIVSGIEATRPSGKIAQTRDSKATIRRGPGSGVRYELGSEIARGGMGRVVEAQDTILGRTVAIKEVLAADEDLIKRFERETRITARLEHPSIIPVHDAGRTPNGTPYYVMRKVSGQPLDKAVFDARSLNERLALLPHMLATANALAHAHSRGVIHRDLKPTNILIGKLGETVVIDWGLAKVIDEPDDPADSISILKVEDSLHTRTGSIIGTPGFMSPEQLRGHSVDAQADVYALGATLYFMLARKVPHAAKSGDEMMDLAKAGPPTPLREVEPGVPAELLTIVDKALSPNIDVRYRDAGGFAHDLERFLAGQLVASHRYTRFERFLRWIKRHRLPVAIATFGAVALAVVGAISISRVVREKRRADAALVATQERNDQLLLSQALSLVPTNPTGAVALARPLVTKHWETARALVMAARARGVPYGLPGSKYTRSLVMASDGIRVLSGGSDGVVRVHDLRARTTRELATLGPDTFATWIDDDRFAVAWSGSKITFLPVGGGERRELTVAEPVHTLRANGKRIWWCDTRGDVWSLSMDDLAPVQIPVIGPVDYLEVHATGVALAGKNLLYLVRDGGAPVTVTGGHAFEMTWSPTGALGAIVELQGTKRVIEVAPHASTLASSTQIDDALALAWQDDVLWIGSERGLGTKAGMDFVLGNGVRQLLPGPGGSLIGRTLSTAFAVIDKQVLLEIPPTYSTHDLATSPTSNFVAAGSDSVVLTWSIDAVRPRDLDLGRPVTRTFAGGDQIVAVHDDTNATWIELPSFARRELETPGGIDSFAFAPDGSSGVSVSKIGAAILYRRGAPGWTPIGLDVVRAAFAGPSQIVVGTASGQVRVVDLAGVVVRELMVGTSAVQTIDVAGDWVAVTFVDGMIARGRLAGGTFATLPADGIDWHGTELFASGELAFTDYSILRVWNTDGTLTTFPGLPTPVTLVESIGGDRLLVYTGGDSAHMVELHGARRAAAVYPPGTRMFHTQFVGDLGAYSSADGALYMTSPGTGVSWRVATPRGSPLVSPLLSADRKTLYAISGAHLLAWSQPVPEDAAETQALFDTLTNAHPDFDSKDSIPVSAPTLRLRWR